MTTHHTALALACFAGLGAASLAAEYVGSDVPGQDGHVATPTDNLGRIPLSAYQPPRTGIPYSSIFRDTGAPYYNALRDVQVNPEAQPMESVGFRGHVDAPDFRGRFPLLQRGFDPENADLKIGPLYFKLRHISLGVLHSDNVNQTQNHRESDTIGVASIGGQILAQLTEGFHIAVSGNLVYLPFEGSGGANGFSLVAPYAFGLAGTPTANAQIAWEPTFFGLPFVIADEFTMGLARFSNTGYDSFDVFDGFETDSADTAGIYTFRAPTVRSFRDSGQRNPDPQNNFEFVYYSNEASISTGGPLPGQNIFRFRASHENIWYEEEGNDLPKQRDRVFLGVESVRDNLRFKPYASYEYIRTVDPDRSGHRVLVGLKGPITDLLDFRGDVGYYYDAENGNGNLIWHLALRHYPDPRTRQSLIFQRDASDFLDELDQNVTYRLTKVLGPDLDASFYTSYHWVEDLDGIYSDREEFRTGLNLNYIQSPRTSYRVIGEYAKIKYDSDFGAYADWRVRFECRHKFLESLYARAFYQYEQRNGEAEVGSFSENLFFLSLSWIFE